MASVLRIIASVLSLGLAAEVSASVWRAPLPAEHGSIIAQCELEEGRDYEIILVASDLPAGAHRWSATVEVALLEASSGEVCVEAAGGRDRYLKRRRGGDASSTWVHLLIGEIDQARGGLYELKVIASSVSEPFPGVLSVLVAERPSPGTDTWPEEPQYEYERAPIDPDSWFPTLFSKTFFVLAVQLFITWAGARLTLAHFRRLHAWHTPWITATRNEAGQLDLHIDWHHLKAYFYGLLIADIATFLLLLFWGVDRSLWISMSIFSVWSILTGIELALCLLSVDENLGEKVLALTATIVFGTGLIGIYSGVDFGFLRTTLFFLLVGLLLFNVARLFVGIPRPTQRWVAGIGVVIFTLYLVHDFNNLAKLEKMNVNSWQVAMRIAIDIYLDIINLFLELLDAMSE